MSVTTAPSVDIAGFVPTPNRILLSPELSPESKLVYQIVRFHDRGRGCFAARETMAREIGLSLYHLRRGICELVDQGIITLEKRRMGLTDIIRLVDQDWGIPSQDQAEEPTEPQFEAPPEPELPAEPPIPEELAQVEEEPATEPIQEEKLVELPDRTIQTPTSNDLNRKYEASNKDHSNKHTCDEADTQKPISREIKASEWQGLIKRFFELKENRQPTKIEIFNWRPTALRLLEEFTYSELLPAVENAVEKGAKLFYFTALTAPAFILDQRQKKQIELDRVKHAEKASEAERQQILRLKLLRRSAVVYDGETKALLNHLEKRIRPQVFRTWFRNAFVNDLTEKSITLAVVSRTAAQWIGEHYADLLKEASGREKVEVISAEEGRDNGSVPQ